MFVINLNFEYLAPYAVCFVLALVAGYAFAWFRLNIKGMSKEYNFYVSILSFVLMLIGSKISTMCFNHGEISFISAGFSSIGAVIGILVSLFVSALIFKDYKSNIFCSYALSIPLLYGISKFGCFLGGCCHGIEFSGFFSTKYFRDGILIGEYFPVQLCESVSFLCLFIGLLVLLKYFSEEIVVLISLSICSFLKFAWDFMREEHVGRIITPNQIICISILFLCVFALIYKKKLVKN